MPNAISPADNLPPAPRICKRCGKQGSTSVRIRGEYWGKDREGNDLHTYWEELLCPDCAAKSVKSREEDT